MEKNLLAAGRQRFSKLIVIGASAGAVESLSSLLPNLPRDFPYPIVIVVHIPSERKSLLAELFNGRCALEVIEANDKQQLDPGTIYFAPPDYHLLVEDKGYLSLSNEEPVNFSRPSIDMLFQSAAEAYASDVIGIVLSGANADGAVGSKAIEVSGGEVLVQDPSESPVAEMPKAALAICSRAKTLRCEKMVEYLLSLRSIG